mmetsp:Transcript_38046/g.104668  ORF Transcript_38046/g.104668 Transcript_38046/m.104668 type:complete len:323 (+) Transcript_38046:93-1061(+)
MDIDALGPNRARSLEGVVRTWWPLQDALALASAEARLQPLREPLDQSPCLLPQKGLQLPFDGLLWLLRDNHANGELGEHGPHGLLVLAWQAFDAQQPLVHFVLELKLESSAELRWQRPPWAATHVLGVEPSCCHRWRGVCGFEGARRILVRRTIGRSSIIMRLRSLNGRLVKARASGRQPAFFPAFIMLAAAAAAGRFLPLPLLGRMPRGCAGGLLRTGHSAHRGWSGRRSGAADFLILFPLAIEIWREDREELLVVGLVRRHLAADPHVVFAALRLDLAQQPLRVQDLVTSKAEEQRHHLRVGAVGVNERARVARMVVDAS